MNQQNHTSLIFSLKLEKSGCKVKGSGWWNFSILGWTLEKNKWQAVDEKPSIPAYDLIWDICIKHAKEFFGEKHTHYVGELRVARWVHPEKILNLLQYGEKQEAEEYFWENTLFNPKNKICAEEIPQVEEMPQLKGTREALDKITIIK